MAKAQQHPVGGDPNAEAAAKVRGTGTKRRGDSPRKVRTNAETLAEAGRVVAEGTANAAGAERAFDQAVGTWAEAERKGTATGASLAVRALGAWMLVAKPTMLKVAEVMDRHGMIQHRVSKVRGANNRIRERDTDAKGNPLVSRQNAQRIMDAAKYSDIRLTSGNLRTALEDIRKDGGLTMPDGQKYPTPLAAMESGRFALSLVWQHWKNRVAPARNVGKLPTNVADAVTADGYTPRVMVQTRKGNTPIPVNALENRDAALAIVVKVLGTFAPLSDTEHERIIAAMTPAAVPAATLPRTGTEG